MSHSHSHDDHEHHNHNSNGLLTVLLITSIYMIAEFAGGIYTNSLALTADAGHMLGDVGALALSYFAMWLASRPASSEKTYGYFRTEIFAAFINGMALVAIALFIIYEAYRRIVSPPEIMSLPMLIIAFGGLIVNLAGIFILHKDIKKSLNIKGAFLHILGDLLGSVGAITSGVLMLFWHFYLADPITSMIIAGLVLYSSISLINNATLILMEIAPPHINVKEVKKSILEIEDIIDVHDLHIWSIDSNKIALSVHVVTEFVNNDKVLHDVNCLLKTRFNICHSTVQIEPEGFDNNTCPLNMH